MAEQAAAEAAHAGQRVEGQEPEHAVGADVPALVEQPVDQSAPAAAARSTKRPRPAGIVPQISSARGCMNSVTWITWSGSRRSSLRTRSKRVGAGLEVGDADDVVIGHGAGEILGRLAGQRVVRARRRRGRGRAWRARPAGRDRGGRRRRPGSRRRGGARSSAIARASEGQLRRDARPRAVVFARSRRGAADRLRLRPRRLGLGQLDGAGARRRDRLGARRGRRRGSPRRPCRRPRSTASKLPRREGQGAGGSQRAEQAGGDDAVVRLGEPLQVVGDEAPGSGLGDCRDPPRIGDAVARRGLLEDAEGAVRGGDQRRAVGRDEAALDGAAGLHQFGGDDDVDVARRRHQREHRRPPGAAGIISR